MKVTLLIPTLNEIIGMKVIMPQIDNDWVDQIIISDGGSTDGTIEWARENGYFVNVQKKKGVRYAYFEVLDLIEGDVVITFSPDGNCLPEAILPLIEEMRKGYDLVIASRYKDEATSEDDGLITGFGNWLFTTTINALHGGNYTDCMGIFRAYKTQLIYDLDLNKDSAYTLYEKLFWTIMSWEPLLSIRAAKRKLAISEIAADEPSRIGGVAKLQVVRWGLAYYTQVLVEFFIWK